MKQLHTKNLLYIIIICTLIFLIIAVQLNGIWLRSFDKEIIGFVQSVISDPLTLFMKMISAIGSVKIITLLTASLSVLLFLFRYYLLALYLSISVAFGAGVLNQLLKHLFHRERPNMMRLVSEHGYSFPSGHAMGSVIFFGGIVFVLYQIIKDKRLIHIVFILSVSLIIFVGLSRIYLGVHYPSDIIGGYAISVIWVLVSFHIYHIAKKRIRKF